MKKTKWFTPGLLYKTKREMFFCVGNKQVFERFKNETMILPIIKMIKQGKILLCTDASKKQEVKSKVAFFFRPRWKINMGCY